MTTLNPIPLEAFTLQVRIVMFSHGLFILPTVYSFSILEPLMLYDFYNDRSGGTLLDFV